MIGHTTISKQWGLRFVPFGRISNDSQLRRFVADEDDAVGWGRSARSHVVLLLLAAAPYRLAQGFARDVRFQKSCQYHGLQNADTSSVLEDLHGRFDLLLTRGTIL
jgi:hypothetical protein